MKRSSLVGAVALCGALVFASMASAQRPARRATAAAGGANASVTATFQAGGESFQFTGRADCAHEPKASIYTVPAQLWSAEQSDGRGSMHLTFWRPASGSGDMFTLSVQGSKTYAADTVKTPYGGSPKGSGVVTFTPAGSGGTFTVNATAANGARITGTIKCDAFRGIYAEGGN